MKEGPPEIPSPKSPEKPQERSPEELQEAIDKLPGYKRAYFSLYMEAKEMLGGLDVLKKEGSLNDYAHENISNSIKDMVESPTEDTKRQAVDGLFGLFQNNKLDVEVRDTVRRAVEGMQSTAPEQALTLEEQDEVKDLVKERRLEYMGEEIKGAQNFGALEAAVTKNGNIRSSSGKVYSPEDIFDLIDRVRTGEPINLITRTGGLRTKVEKLLENEVQEKPKGGFWRSLLNGD